MAENGCQYHTDHTHRLEKLEERTEELDDRVTSIDKNFGITLAQISVSLDALARLPEAIDSLKDSNNKVEVKVDNIGKDVNNLELKVDSKVNSINSRLSNEVNSINGRLSNAEKTISSIDDDGKINFRQWVKTNAFKIVFVTSIVIAIVGFWFEKTLK